MFIWVVCHRPQEPKEIKITDDDFEHIQMWLFGLVT